MTVEIISDISTKVWDRVGVKFTTPGSAVRHLSAARHVTDNRASAPCQGFAHKGPANIPGQEAEKRGRHGFNMGHDEERIRYW